MKKPNFLIVLCILSFAGIITMLIIDSMEYLYVESITAQLLDVSNLHVHQMPAFKLQQIPESVNALSVQLSNWNVAIFIIEIIGLLLCLLGVLFMWKKREKGFFIYLIGQLVSIITPIVFVVFFYSLGNDIATSTILNTLSVKLKGAQAFFIFLWLLSPIVSIVFILLHRVNLKIFTTQTKQA